MAEASYLAALLVGLTGFVHCAAMCGGIVAVVSANTRAQGSTLWTYILLYNVGRIVSYIIAGLVAGVAGQWLASWLPAMTALVVAQILIGIFLIALGLHLTGLVPLMNIFEKAGTLLWRFIEPLGRRFIPVSRWHHALVIGLLWGWLPCSMVYAVLVWALASGSVVDGAMIMAFFGIGTLPALVTYGVATRLTLKATSQRWFRIAAGVIVILVGIWHLVSLYYAGAHHGHH